MRENIRHRFWMTMFVSLLTPHMSPGHSVRLASPYLVIGGMGLLCNS